MIITINSQASSQDRAQLMSLLNRLADSMLPAVCTSMGSRDVLVIENKAIDPEAQQILLQHPAVEKLTPVKTPYQLVSRTFQQETSSITIGNSRSSTPVTVGGTTSVPVIMAGPCSVENREQILRIAREVKEAGGQVLRGGAFKPRTSPYQFQGLGVEGLRLLAEAREETGLPVITEVMDIAMLDTVAEYTDVLQIGARNMQNYALLQAVGRHSKKLPVLLKRGLSATIEEWLLAAEYIVASGNPNVMLCERGIRSYDTQTRNVLDLTCVPLLQELTHLPVIIDPSHATGKRELVPAMSRASIAAGAHGLIIETHYDPAKAISDARQTISTEQLRQISREARELAHILRGDAVLDVA
uniref:3-deoxy-7-phosphoheptulonate synthase n=1 Tax=Thermosporothrix sp. COM3 TaxID=2490863 RepID=A0A455SRZ4_9CHLR|nr:3-deoxy-7-phosphoheptulonate synthase [Thermosporothrix sp. COM3]